MTTIPPLEKNRELHRVLALAKDLRLQEQYTEIDDDAILVLQGADALKLAPRFQTYIKKGVLQGNMGPDALRFVWDKGNAADVVHENLHPISKEKDDEVLALIPSRVTSHEQLEKLCGALREKIEEAYPKVLLHHKGFGKGKWLLVDRIMLDLWVRTDSLLNRANMIILLELMPHFQTAPDLDRSRLTHCQLPAAFAE